MSWPEVRDVMEAGSDQKEEMEAGSDQKEALVLLCSEDVHAGLEEWLKKGKNRNYADDVHALFEDPDKTLVFMETKIDHAYKVLCARTEAKYEKDNATKARNAHWITVKCAVTA